jgi:membrane associated rhomboid family serine protease
MPIRLTQTVKALLIICFVSFIVQHTADQFFGTDILRLFGLVPASFLSQFRIWQLITYPFIHSDVMHLFFNLLMIAFIGSELEVLWGRARFLTYFFVCSISSGVVYLLLQSFLKGTGLYAPLIGASGPIYGLLMAYGLFFGERVLLFMMLFPMKAKHFIWVLALIELMTTLYSPGGAWASIAQLSSMLTGFAYLWIRASLIASKKRRDKAGFANPRAKKRKNHHLKLIVNNDKDIDSLDEDDSENNPKTWH